MPRNTGEDHEQFRGILSGTGSEYLKAALASRNKLYNRRSAEIHIPAAPLPNFTWNGSEYAQDQPAKKKPKLYRSIEEPFEPGW